MYAKVLFISGCTRYRLKVGYTSMKNTVLLHHFYVDNSVFALQQCFLIGFVFSFHVVRFRALKTAPGFLA